ncbi:MAG TPA: DUF58 domain-containing protein [Flavobacteriales bacterium]|nr:DUF58 domain-containing protein [Flavobacteriales bacterium]HCA83632.1 DUF58 domain-containing protein [Flavobacteriales bacterium]
MLDTRELLKKVRKIEIKTKGLSEQIFSGEYHSAFKGRGMAFSEVREYFPGDDIRTIDWNVTARFNHPYVKVFEEERELTVTLLLDLSGSSDFGTKGSFKRELIAEIAAVIAFSALKNNDKVGAIFFTDTVERFIPPKKGKTHILRIISDIISFEPKSKGTDLAEPLRFLTNAIKKRSIAFVLSDFITENAFDDTLRIAARRHDIVALEIFDERELELPNAGIIRLRDNESGKTRIINSSLRSVRTKYKANMLRRKDALKSRFRKAGVDHAAIATGSNYIRPLMQLFKSRGK